MDYFTEPRKSYIETINNWYRLLEKNAVKDIITDSLRFLSESGKIDVYGFVVMPNHIHLIWKINEMNGKESSHGSFLKYTAHVFKKYLKANDSGFLNKFAVEAENKKYQFWKRDSLAFELTKRDTAFQKLNYIHNNPLAERWQICDDRVKYYYSSAKFYETGVDDFGFLKHIMDVF